jgi:hypothetical protein
MRGVEALAAWHNANRRRFVVGSSDVWAVVGTLPGGEGELIVSLHDTEAEAIAACQEQKPGAAYNLHVEQKA